MSTLLVIAAWEPELVRFRALGLEALTSRVTDPSPLKVVAEAIGVGLVDATIGVTRCIERHKPSVVLLLGTAGGACGSRLRINDVIVASSVRLVDPAVVEGHAAMVREEELRIDERVTSAFVDAGARAASIANTIGITTDDALAERLASRGEVEHLEAYGVARACQSALPNPIPCAIVLGIANMVGAKGRDEWRANHLAASARAAEVAIKGIEKFRTSTTTRSPARS